MIELLDHVMALGFWNKIFLLLILSMLAKVLIVLWTVFWAILYGIITGEDVKIK